MSCWQLPIRLLLVLTGLNSDGIRARAAETPATDLGWVSTGAMTSPRVHHTATLLHSGKVLVAGGYLGLESLSTAELYDPDTGSWTPTGSMAQGRDEHSATLLPSGRVLVVGGYTSPRGIPVGELYDPDTGTWTLTKPMAVDHQYGHTATLLRSGKVLVAGGTGTDGIPLTIAEVYDPDTNSWTLTRSMTDRRDYHQAVLLPTGKILVVGQHILYEGQTSAELYDPDLDQWAPVQTPMENPRGHFTATLLPSGKVLVAGGTDSDHGFDLFNSEIYDPVANGWSTLRGLWGPRVGHTATLLPSGKVLLVGGTFSTENTPLAQLYDPVTERWTDLAPSGMTYRNKHTATLLYSGRVLIAGGDWETTQYASAELSAAEARPPPAARPLRITTTEDQSVPIELVGLDVDGDSLTFIVMKPPTHGTLSGTTPSLVYTPTADFHGSDAFTYKVTDGTLDSSTVTVWLSVMPADDPPQALPLFLSTFEGQSLQVLLPETDKDGDTLTSTLVTLPVYGRLSGTAPHLTYHPPKRSFGQDSFTYQVSDGRRQSETALVSISVIPSPPNGGGCSATGSRPSHWGVTFVLLGTTFLFRRRHRHHEVPVPRSSSRRI